MKLLIEEIFNIWRSSIHTSITDKHSVNWNSWFQSIQDEDYMEWNYLDSELIDYMEKDSCVEWISLISLKTDKIEKKIKKAARDWILGLGKRDIEYENIIVWKRPKLFSESAWNSENTEPSYLLTYYFWQLWTKEDNKISYKDYSWREWQMLQLKIVIPEHLLKKIKNMIKGKNRVAFVRELTKFGLQKKMLDNKIDINFEETRLNWEENKWFPLKPPYEAFDNNWKKPYFLIEE